MVAKEMKKTEEMLEAIEARAESRRYDDLETRMRILDNSHKNKYDLNQISK